MNASQVRSAAVVGEAGVEEHVALGKLLWVAPLLLLAALVANSVIRAVALALNANSSQFVPVAGPAYIFVTAAAVIGAVLAFIAVARFARRPLTWYLRIALVVLPLSFIPDLGLLVAPPDPAMQMGTVDAFSVGALMVMHVITAALCIGLLTRLTRAGTAARS